MPKILIVEDEPSVADVLKSYLDDMGFDTETVPDGQAAVRKAQQERPSLIIMDLMMPRLTGGEAARLLKRDPSTADIPILAISGMTDARDFADVLQVDAILAKPFDLSDLRMEVVSLLHIDTGDVPSSPQSP